MSLVLLKSGHNVHRSIIHFLVGEYGLNSVNQECSRSVFGLFIFKDIIPILCIHQLLFYTKMLTHKSGTKSGYFQSLCDCPMLPQFSRIKLQRFPGGSVS